MKICDELNKYLLLKLGKDNINEQDIENIKSLSLVFDKNNNVIYNFKDLMYFKNLEELIIQRADINNLEINCINRVDTLKKLVFSECNFKAKCNLCNNVEDVWVQKSKNFKNSYLSGLNNLKNLKVE